MSTVSTNPVESDERVVRVGTAAFRCLADECGAMCCRNPYRVDLGEDEVARLASVVAIDEVLDERASMALMRQIDDRCVLLSDDLRCAEYQARPNGCRSYPFRLEQSPGETTIVLRDLACPGFVGPPMDESQYRDLVEQLSSPLSREHPTNLSAQLSSD